MEPRLYIQAIGWAEKSWVHYIFGCHHQNNWTNFHNFWHT